MTVLLLARSQKWSAVLAKSFATHQNPTARLESSSIFHDFRPWDGERRFLCGKA